MNPVNYWDQTHQKYQTTSWIDQPSLFSQWAVKYFPTFGRLLDLGAGQGQDSRYFNGLGYEVTAIDFSPTAIELGRYKSPGVEFKLIDLSDPLPFGDEAFDVAYAHLSLHYFDSVATARLFRDIHRILKPGGVFAALFNSTDDPEMTEGKQLEDGYFEFEGGLRKRFFNTNTLRPFVHEFNIITLDNQGTTYKDEAKGVHNLIRLTAKKP